MNAASCPDYVLEAHSGAEIRRPSPGPSGHPLPRAGEGIVVLWRGRVGITAGSM